MHVRARLLALAAVLLMPLATTLPVQAAVPIDNAGHLYTLDGWGGVHSVGSSPTLGISGYWSGWDIARGIALFADGTGGYTVDGFGGVHAVGSAPPIGNSSHDYWPGWDIVRGVVMAPWATAASPAGWTLDGFGGINAFGGAPSVTNASHAYWPGWDIARGLVVFPDSAAGTAAGYILDGFGGLHGWSAGGVAQPAQPQSTAYWAGWDIARSTAFIAGTHQGYVLDGYGGVHGFAPPGEALPAGYTNASHAYWAGWDIARSVTTWSGAPAGSPGGWIMDGYGGLHTFGSAPYSGSFAYWPGWDIAKGSAGAGSGSSGKPPTSPVLQTSHILNVPYYHQQYALSCEEAALQMALAYEGVGASQGDILNVIGIDWRRPFRDGSGFHWGDPYASFVGDPNGSESNYTGYGTYFSAIGRAAEHYGAQVRHADEGYPASSVYNDILNGHPVIAWISVDYLPHRNVAYTAFDGRPVQFGSPYEHAVTVIGVTSDSVLVNDPLRRPLWISKATFETAYAVFNQMSVTL